MPDVRRVHTPGHVLWVLINRLQVGRVATHLVLLLRGLIEGRTRIRTYHLDLVQLVDREHREVRPLEDVLDSDLLLASKVTVQVGVHNSAVREMSLDYDLIHGPLLRRSLIQSKRCLTAGVGNAPVIDSNPPLE